jgi:FlaA1/EpsC-like NDP-sugar epimerase
LNENGSAAPGPPSRTSHIARVWSIVMPLATRPRGVRRSLKAIADVTAWMFAISIATALRYEVIPAAIEWSGVPVMVVLAATVHLLVGGWLGLYSGRRRTGSFDEVSLLFATVVATTALITLVNLAAGSPRLIPLTSSVTGGAIALVLVCGSRFLWRAALNRVLRPSGHGAARLIVIGAGEAGQQIVRSMLSQPNSPYLPVALVDDDRSKVKLEVMGVPVSGTTDDLARVATETRADAALIALPSADGALVRQLSRAAHAAGLSVHVLPRVEMLLDDGVGVSDVRELTPADLLGREPLNTDVEQIAGYLTGKRVMVTGAGGSIGSELCRQIQPFAPASLVMLDRDEAALHSVQLSLDGRGLLDSPDLVLCDIRDRDALERCFDAHRPHVVFHAAALKHLPLLERFPDEALRTNVWGTLDIMEIAAGRHVEHFVNISTDKAADPTSVLGYTKRIAERLTAHVSRQAAGVFVSVRFGNVLGSRGSVLTAFESQIARGGPLTVTHPDVTRYFMTVEEACQLVIQAGAIGENGEALVLDMGQPVRIAEVAQTLADQASRPIEVVYTGLRPGEKLHEQLFATGEIDRRPRHRRVSHVEVPPLDPALARSVDVRLDIESLVQEVMTLSTNGASPGPGTEKRRTASLLTSHRRNGHRS